MTSDRKNERQRKLLSCLRPFYEAKFFENISHNEKLHRRRYALLNPSAIFEMSRYNKNRYQLSAEIRYENKII